KEVCVMHRVWKKACGDARAGVVERVQRCIDCIDVCLRNSDQTILIEEPLLEVGEVECAVFHQRSPQASAILGLRQWSFGACKRIGSIQSLMSEEAIRGTMKRIGAALGHHVDVSAESPAKLCLSS